MLWGHNASIEGALLRATLSLDVHEQHRGYHRLYLKREVESLVVGFASAKRHNIRWRSRDRRPGAGLVLGSMQKRKEAALLFLSEPISK